MFNSRKEALHRTVASWGSDDYDVHARIDEIHTIRDLRRWERMIYYLDQHCEHRGYWRIRFDLLRISIMSYLF